METTGSFPGPDPRVHHTGVRPKVGFEAGDPWVSNDKDMVAVATVVGVEEKRVDPCLKCVRG